MLTIFASPKPFDDEHINTIQRNAIRSWLMLKPRPQVILFGNERGTAEICKEFSIEHVPGVETNEFGTPLLNDIFSKAESLARTDLLCYINSDILLMSDFSDALRLVAGCKERFLMGGRPWEIDLSRELSFEAGWEEVLRSRTYREGRLRSPRSCDYFVYSRGLWKNLPPFAVGRAYFDNALLYMVRQHGAALVDTTRSVVAIHQNHGKPAHLANEQMLKNDEAQRNVALAQGWDKLLTWKSATHVVNGGRVRLSPLGCLRFFGPHSRTSNVLRRMVDSPMRVLNLVVDTIYAIL